MKDLIKQMVLGKRGLDEILDDVDTLCNNDCSPITEEMKEAVKQLIKEANKLR